MNINPNYFGSFEKSKIKEIAPVVFPKQGDTRYEKLECIGLFPERDEVEAVFNVNLPYGFGGNLCSDGSKEYIAFYIDYGTGFQPVGPAVTVNTHNLSAVRRGPLCCAVKQSVDFKKKKCQEPFIIKLRAILSWNVPPAGPNYVPTWGNSEDAWIQIDPVKPISYNTDYEKLTCVGLYPERDTLEAIVAVTRQNGYKGNLCSVGSEEYVAFYVDWGDGSGYQHEGTTFFKAHDIKRKENPLMYAVNLRIKEMDKKLKRCKEENVVRVRAILSWEVAPTGPSYKPAWGNVLNCNIQIRPRTGQRAKCEIQHVNKVLVEDINGEGYARKVIDDTTLSPTIFNRPFGSIIAIWGNVHVPAAAYYRMGYSEDNGTTWNTVTDKRRYKIKNFTVGFRTPDANGWFSKNTYLFDLGNYSDTPVAQWHSGTRSGKHIIRLELADLFKNPIAGPACQVTVYLDKQNVEHYSFIGSTIPQQGVIVKDGAGAIKKCGKYVGGEEVVVYGNFHDQHFNVYSLELFGGNLASSGVSITPAASRYDQAPLVLDDYGTIGATDPGNGTQLTSVDMIDAGANVACSYGIRMVTSDRAILGYFSTYIFKTTSHSNDAYVTFDWEP